MKNKTNKKRDELAKEHQWYLVLRSKIICPGPMQIFIRCRNKKCVGGVEFSGGKPKERLKYWKEVSKGDKCPFIWKWGKGDK